MTTPERESAQARLASLDGLAWPEATAGLDAWLRATFEELTRWSRARALDAAAEPAAWSAREVLEHVTRADHFLLKLADKLAERAARRAARGVPWPAGPPDFAGLACLASSEFRWESPAHMRPTGGVALERIEAALERDAGHAAELLRRLPAGEGTLHRIRFSPVDRHLDLYQYLAVLGLHAARHLASLERRAGS